MLQAGNIDLSNPIDPKAHNSECQNIHLKIKPVKVNLKLIGGFLSFALMG